MDGKIDINSSDIIETVGWLVNTGKINLIFNLENVDMVDYNGLSILAIAYKNIVNHKGKLRFLNVPLSVVELFKVVKLENAFEVYSDEETAIDSFYNEAISDLHLRRKFARLDIHLVVKYKLAAAQKKAKTFEGRVLNISAAGLYIYTVNTLPMNTPLDLEFNLPNSSSRLEASGRVSWVADKEIQPHAYPGMGVSFVHLTTEKEQAIIDFIEKNITHRADPL
jgi:anti-sigma B factor antagonist